MQLRAAHFTLALVLSCLAGFGASAAALAPQDALEVAVGGKKYLLPAAGETTEESELAPPVDAATLATIETWRAFAWDAGKKKYLYRFGAAAETSAGIVLTADSSAGEFAKDLDRTAQRVVEYVGADRLRKTYVAVVCATQAEYERAVDFAAERALALTEDPIQRAYLADAWRASSKKSPTFHEPHAGVVGCVEGNSEKWSPQHEVIRGFAQVALLGHAPYLSNVLPLMAGLSWNAEYDVTGEILSIPHSDEFQFDIGRGAWSTSKIDAALTRIAKEVKKREKRDLALRDLPYLHRGATSTADAAGIGWAIARHLIRHHGAQLPALLTALSDEVVAQNTVLSGDGSTKFALAPGYLLGWEQVDAVFAAQLPDYRFAALAECISGSCDRCKDYAAERGLR